MEFICRGRLSVEVNDQRTQAALVFSADAAGEAWSKEQILSLLQSHALLDFVKPSALEQALVRLKACARGAVRLVVADGLAPDTLPKAVRWEEHPVPEGLAAEVERICRQAPAPRVFAWRFVQKPAASQAESARPGQAQAAVTEAVMEKPPALGPAGKTGIVPAGALVATLSQAASRPEFYYSEGLALEEDRLVARAEGILRTGSDWAELIPFRPTRFSLVLTEDGSDCLLDFEPGDESRPAVTAEKVLSRARELGVDQTDLLPWEGLAALMRDAWEKKAPFHGRSLCRARDAVCQITVSEDKQEARFSLKKNRGRGRALSLSDVSARIKGAGFAKLEKAQLKEDIVAFFHDPARRTLDDYPLARGSPPAAGEDGAIEWEVSFIPEAAKRNILSRFEKQPDAEKVFPSLKIFPVSAVVELAPVAPEGKIARLTPPTRGRAGADVYGRTLEGLPGKAVEVEAFEHVKKYGMYLVSEIQGYLEYGKKGGAVALRVRPHQDASAAVEVSLDGRQAFLTIRPHRGYGEPISSPKVFAALGAERVTAGLKEKAIEQAVAAAQDGREVNRLLVAEGQAPVHAQGAKLVVKVRRDEGQRVRILKDGRADYKSVSNIAIVHAGDLVAEITPPMTRAVNGFDVYGKPLIARLKPENELPPLVNLKQVPAAAGVMNLYAEKDGEFAVTPTAAGVRQIHVIPGDVGLATGNIDFPGSVLVQGSVREGFRVAAKGTLTVNGLVEEALLSAEGAVVILQGMKGRKHAVARTRAGIACLFAENALLMAVGDISLERSALNCTIKTNGRLEIGKTKGTLMGGAAKARKGMTLVNLGSPAEAKTLVSFGQDYILGDQIESGEREVEKLKNRIREIDRLMPNLMSVRPEDAARLRILREEKTKLLKIIDQYGVRLFSLRERFEEHYPGTVAVRGTVYPGVVIESHGRHYTVRTEAAGVEYDFDPKTGAIQEKPLILSRRQAPVRRPTKETADEKREKPRMNADKEKTKRKHE